MKLGAVVRGDRELSAKFEQSPVRWVGQVLQKMRVLGVELSSYVRKSKLSGQVLKNRSGNLRTSVGTDTQITGSGISTRVGVFGGPTEVYGRFWEFGFHGDQQVREHLREVRMAFGREIEATKATVRAHTRKVDVDPRSFLGSALDDREAYLTEQLEALAARAAQEALA